MHIEVGSFELAKTHHEELRTELEGVESVDVRRLLGRLDGLYMIDLVCDPDLQPFYEKFDFRPYSAMTIRRFDRQSGKPVGR